MNALSRGVVPHLVFAFLTVLVRCGPAALAQTRQSDYERLRQEGLERDQAAYRANLLDLQRRQEQERQLWEQRGQQQQQREQQEQDKRRYLGALSDGGNAPPSSPSGDNSAETRRAVAEARASFEKQPPLPASRNPLLGKWQLQRSNSAAQNSL